MKGSKRPRFQWQQLKKFQAENTEKSSIGMFRILGVPYLNSHCKPLKFSGIENNNVNYKNIKEWHFRNGIGINDIHYNQWITTLVTLINVTEG